MIAYEKICLENRPDWIVVVGDVNSTVACAMVGAKLWIPVVHLEAGLRSGDRQHARGDQPAGHRRHRRRAVDALGGCRREPAAEGVDAGQDRPDRQHHDRFVRDAARQDRGRRNARERPWTRRRAIRAGHPAPAVQRGRRGDLAPIVEALTESPRACRWCSSRIRGRSRASRRSASESALKRRAGVTVAGAAALHTIHERGDRLAGRHHRLGRPAGRDDLSGHSLPDAARKHRATDHRHPGHQQAGSRR